MKAIIKQSHIEIHGYHLGYNQMIEKAHSNWDSIYHRWNPFTMEYDEEKEILYLPRGDMYCIGLLDIDDSDVTTDYNPSPSKPCTTNILYAPRDEMQEKSINFLMGNGAFSYNKAYPQIILNLPPGAGKTFCAISMICNMKYRSLIITHTVNVQKQWLESFEAFTDVKPSQILKLDTKIFDKILNDGFDYREIEHVFVIHAQLQSLIKKYGWDIFNETIAKLCIGVKVIDEAHLHYRHSFIIDSRMNIKKNVYLSATWNRSQYEEDDKFKKAFRRTPRFGDEYMATAGQHIVYISVTFNSKPTPNDMMFVNGKTKYFNKFNYTKYQMDKGIISEMMIKLHNKLFSNYTGRMMVLSSLKESCEYFADNLKEVYPDKNIGIYNSSIYPEIKKGVKDNAEIISSTPTSLGTGSDIPGLRFLYMIEPFSSKVNALQNPSRLRKLPNGELCYYIEFIDEGFPDVVRWYKSRLKEYSRYFKIKVNTNYDEIMKEGM